MKKALSLLLALMLLASALPAAAEDAEFFNRPSSEYRPDIAQQALTIAELCYRLFPQQLLMLGMGYRKVGDYNMDRDPGDTRHVAGYVLYDKKLSDGRTAVVLAVRGTAEGEWPLNMDLMPSGDYGLSYAENFSLAAQDVLSAQADYLAALESPVFLVTGHSRGAAVANLLGAALSERFGRESVYAYTFASPRTVRGELPAYDNIFNIINPCDLVTYLPFPQWGFVRCGRDLILPVETADEAARQKMMSAYALRLDKLGEDVTLRLSSAAIDRWTGAMTALMPTVEEAYTLRHALNRPGEAAQDEPGMTAWALMETLISAMLRGDKEQIFSLISPTQAAENDFSAAAEAIWALMEESGPAALGSAHMPATYGAWMSVLEP